MGIERLSGNVPLKDLLGKTETKRIHGNESPEKAVFPETGSFQKPDFVALRAELSLLEPSALDSLHRISKERVTALLP